MINYCNHFPFVLLFGAHKEKEKDFFFRRDKKQEFEGVVIAITL